MNIVSRLEEIALSEDWKFVHSTDFGQNLFDEILESRQTVLMIESPIDFTDAFDDNSNIISTKVRVKMMLLRSSDIADPIGNETGYSRDAGRYNNLILPLLNEKNTLINKLLADCECNIKEFGYKDIYGVLDFNLDGIIINIAYECAK